MKSLSREEVRSIDSCAINQLRIPGVVLMENAGRNAAEAIEVFFDKRLNCGSTGLADKAVAVVAGAGNNGGDGFVVARHLANRGARLVTFLVAPEEKIHGDAEINLTAIRNLGHDIRPISGETIIGLADLAEKLKKFDLIVDSVGGTGISGPLRGEIAAAVQQINTASRAGDIPVVAIDIPTGLDCDTGLADGPAVRADLTVTFVACKRGFDNPASEQYTGLVQVADIGIDPAVVMMLGK